MNSRAHGLIADSRRREIGPPLQLSTLSLLATTTPTWATSTIDVAGELQVIAAVPRAGGQESRSYRLRVVGADNSVAVFESQQSELLPKFCPERHINPSGDFCLGLDAGKKIDNADAARVWWSQLLVFLSFQESAHESRAWPGFAQLSHGEPAAMLQLEAEQLSDELGVKQLYRDALLFDSGLIAECARRFDAQKMRPRNGRATCACGRRDKRGRVQLRRRCWRAAQKCLVELEFLRRREVRKFWKVFKGRECCGTMDECPLRKQ